jgi:CheY-like chemotaxis protein
MCNFSGPILLVEDEPPDAALFRRALQRASVQPPVVHLPDGDEAVNYLVGEGKYRDRQNYPLPSTVVLDIKLPRRSGFEVLEWIRSQSSDVAHVPVVVLSSSNMSSDVVKAYRKGANAYVTKPLTSQEYGRMTEILVAFWTQYNEQSSCPRMRR